MIKRVKNKIPAEQLIEDAWDWYNELPEFEAENIVIEAYKEAKNILDEDVEE